VSPDIRLALGSALALFGAIEVTTMLLGQSILWRIVCGSRPPTAGSDCLVPGVVRGAVLLAAVGGIALLVAAEP